MITELIAVAVTGTAAVLITRTVMRRRLAADYDRLDDYADELDHKAAMLEARHDEDVQWAWQLDDWRDKLCAYADDLRKWEQELDAKHRRFDPEDPETWPVQPEPESTETEQPAWAEGHADLPHLHAVYGTQPEPVHFESDAIDAGLTRLLEEGCWDAALARMVALRTETGSYPVVTATWPGSGDTSIPKRGGDDEMPTPLPPTKPVVPAALKPLAIRRIHEAVTAGTGA